jgi:hypothetical protein
VDERWRINFWRIMLGLRVLGVFSELETIFGELRVHWLLGIFIAMEGFH